VADSAAAIIDGVRDALDHGTQLTYAYHRDLDAAMHLHGVGSTEWLTAAAEADVLIAGMVDVLPPDSALLVTADEVPDAKSPFSTSAADRPRRESKRL
jgi:hypothetical protein